MLRSSNKPHPVTTAQARRIWLQAQRLDSPAPFGEGPEATRAAVEHLGYVQIDTINVIERCHHHILWTRIPAYRREHLQRAQSVDKSVFEYWTHALSYVPTKDLRFFIAAMKKHRKEGHKWFSSVTKADLRKVLTLIRKDGALTIRDIDDDVLVEKQHLWASRKPSKRALQLAFYTGVLTISERNGMLKTYELTGRHFGWDKPPRPASAKEMSGYLLDRALRSQGIVSLDSVCYMDAKRKPAVRQLIESRVRRKELVPIELAARASRSTGRSRMLSRPAGPPRSWSTSSRRSTLSSSSANALTSSSTTSIASRRTYPRRSGCSAISPCLSLWATTLSPPSISRRTARSKNCWFRNGHGSVTAHARA